MRTRYKSWTKPFIDEHPDYALTDEAISSLDNFYLEIGSGKGDFIVEMSKKFPLKQFVGVEKNVTCAGITLKKIVEAQLTNIKLLYRDGAEFVKLLKPQSVNVIYLNFSDPWPKKRHSKRRLTSSNFIEEYKRILKKDGKIIFKTDNLDLYNFSLEMFLETKMKILSSTTDYQIIDPDDAFTEYEISFRKQGVKIKRLVVGL